MKEIQKRMNIEEFKKTSSKPIKLLTKREYYDNIYLESMKDYFGDDVPNCMYEAIESGKHIDYILEDLKTREIIPINASEQMIWFMLRITENSIISAQGKMLKS